MKRLFIPALGVALAVVLSVPATGRSQFPEPRAVKETTLRGKVVRVAVNSDSFVVQTPDGREVTLHPGPRTHYVLDGREVQSYDVKPGASVTAVFDSRDGRNVPRTVAVTPVPPAVAPVVVAPAPAPVVVQERLVPAERPVAPAPPAVPVDANRLERLHGRIVGFHQNPSYLILRTADGHEMNLYLDNRQEVTATVVTRDGRPMISTLTAPLVVDERPRGVEPAPAAAGPLSVEGTIVRVVGPQNQIVVRTADGREMTFYADPQTVYRLGNGVTQIGELPQGAPVTVQYVERDRRPIARAILGRRR